MALQPGKTLTELMNISRTEVYEWLMTIESPLALVEQAKDIMKGLASFFGNVWKGIKSAVVTIVKGFVNAIVTVIKVKFAVIKAALTLLKHAFSVAFKGIRTLAGVLLNALRAVFSKIKGVFSKVKSFLSWFGGLGKKAYNWGKDLVGGFIKGLASHVRGTWGRQHP